MSPKLIGSTVASVATIFAFGSASAVEDSTSWTVKAEVSAVCEFFEVDTSDVDFEDLREVPTSTYVIRGKRIGAVCNTVAPTMQYNSANGGYMVRAGGSASNAADRIAYEVNVAQFTGVNAGNGWGSPSGSEPILGGALNGLRVGKIGTPDSGPVGGMLFRAKGVGEGRGSTVRAGEYSDVFTLTIVGN